LGQGRPLWMIDGGCHGEVGKNFGGDYGDNWEKKGQNLQKESSLDTKNGFGGMS